MQAVIDGLLGEICIAGFRGCPFINAAAEYPDPASPIHRAVLAHRSWFRGMLAELIGAIGIRDAERAADTLVMLRDGAMVGGYLDTPDTIRARLTAAVDTLLGGR